MQREAEKRHEASQQALTATALAAHQKIVAEISNQRDKTVEAVRADAGLQMAQREREIFDQAREAVVQVEGGKRMAEVTAQAIIGELQQKYDTLLLELEDHQRQHTGLAMDLDAARQYASQVYIEGINKDAALQISVNAEANAQVRLSAMTSEVAKWQQVAERHQTLNAGASSSSQFCIHSPVKDEPHPIAQNSTRSPRGSSPKAAASRQEDKRSSTAGASGKRGSLTAASKGTVPPANPHLDIANKRIAALEKRIADTEKLPNAAKTEGTKARKDRGFYRWSEDD